MNEYAESLLRLPGTEEEREWLESRLETMSVKEGIVLAAAVERSPPETMMDAVNHLLTLEQYDVIPAGSYEQLGAFYLWNQCVPQEQRPFFDQSALGQWYEDEHPGLFVGNCYVAYPKQNGPLLYDGSLLPQNDECTDWSVRLKLASEAVPDGVWVKLPDYEGFTEKPDEVRLALDALGIQTVDECTLLDTRCILPEVTNLAGQYESLADLMYDGDSLGYILDDHCQGNSNYLAKFFAALEFEHCTSLKDALKIAQNLVDYELTSVDAFIDEVTQELSQQLWAKAGDGVKGCFDYVAYANALAEQQGYSVTEDEQFYIRKRDSPKLEPQQGGMTMQ